jgi:hypothetical protein
MENVNSYLVGIGPVIPVFNEFPTKDGWHGIWPVNIHHGRFSYYSISQIASRTAMGDPLLSWGYPRMYAPHPAWNGLFQEQPMVGLSFILLGTYSFG